ncbi:MAG: molecular chaperone HtpG [Cyclobacteriaceae bacterium]|nr:molecular chaperone HtpG [Cyclobacteriaceae bacterium]MCH8516132.1 molecular chaperone HtpG [Cyclobacteriaceae bacterium]
MQENGTISIHTENIFPIIKKALYSDQEIFLRELVSNAIDATQKIKRLSSLGEYTGELGDLKVEVKLDKEAKTITISDYGIGMTAEEIKKYINQIAFSGATEFIEKYKDQDSKEIIGHFGLGFYSAFMVAKKVEIVSLSREEGAQAAHWECDGSTEFSIKEGTRDRRGTDIILHVMENEEEFLEEFRLKGILEKYCKFLPVPIFFGEDQINKTEPLWVQSPSELKDEDYLKFYKELYPFSEDPLFWIHLNVDFPFELTGILYFPKFKNDMELQKNKIQLYSRQVFITDEVKDIVPEFLMLLHGVIDSPDIPLNVSRSFLQSDSNVRKITGHITKKVADKLAELFKSDRKAYEEKWPNIGLFVKYGMITDDKFYDKVKDAALLKNTKGEFFTIKEYEEKIAPTQTDKDENKIILYTTDPGKQDAYIQSANRKGYDVTVFDEVIDSHFINTLETKFEKVSLKRVDSDVVDKLIDKDEKHESSLSEKETEKIKALFEKIIDDKNQTVQVEPMPVDETPVTITLPEFMRRMNDMAAAGGGPMGMMGQMPNSLTVSINANHELIGKILKAKSDDKKEKLAQHAYDLALLSQNMLTGSKLTGFINRSINLVN